MSLFVKKPLEQDLLNIGKHCDICRQLDFLPFTCEDCSKILCSEHRSHKCAGKRAFVPPTINTSKLPTAQSLFPDRENDRRKVDAQLLRPTPAVNIIGTSAVIKLNKYLNVHKNSTLGKLFGVKAAKPGKASKPLKTSDILVLKKEAKGDSRVLPADRLYLWVIHIDTKESPRQAVYVSKSWVIGRALDSIADTLRIKNVNNTVQSQDEKLHVFKVEPEVKMLENNVKVSSLKSGDLVYLVMGLTA